MNLKDKPAFARPFSECGPRRDGNTGVYSQEGMTLREYYAGLAMQGAISNSITRMPFGYSLPNSEIVAGYGLRCADALIAELEKMGGEK